MIKFRNNSNEAYYMKNGHGDTTQTMNADGSILKDYSYDAFGNQNGNTDNDLNPFRYCGEYFDDETGNIYLRARYYNPSTGRFLSEDPIMDGLNWYSYCSGNPVMFVDPSGLNIILCDAKDTNDERFVSLQTLTNDELALNTETGEVSINKANEGNLKTGTALIREIISNEMECLINTSETEEPITLKFTYDDGKESLNIIYNSNFEVAILCENTENGEISKILIPNYIVMGHELIHVYNCMYNKSKTSSGAFTQHDYKAGIPNSYYTETGVNREELETVGIDYTYTILGDGMTIYKSNASSNQFTENKIRTEHGLALRIKYLKN